MAGENYNSPQKQTSGMYMDQEWFFQGGMYKVPSLGISMAGTISDMKAAIREKLEQRESVDPIGYIANLLEMEIKEATNQLFEQEFNEGCGGESMERYDKKKGKKKVKTS